MFKLSFIILSSWFVLLSHSAYGQSPTISSNHISGLRFDTSKTAVLKFEGYVSWIFDSTHTPARLTQSDLWIIDSFLLIAVGEFNSWQQKNNSGNPWKIDLGKFVYRKQLITVTNKKGEKEVWVNCFCSIANNDWKSAPIFVLDGATCYFNFKINLTTNVYYDFAVNSAA